ncbi:UDP-N-acetylmuramoyl-L-alanine--D-glutamate ligase [Dactylosporangium siamense]|uniref:UDP-N-acetylmuramoyl-L-alanine--L-glutamate ligase n=1 Tax=Dactylosporangium siamense TaxID=685454 RepID=A0A919PSZ9_9ACTN|nr:UDP-N-acetylmuramoyl-L-alanine--D-glutamate ligase [Dactylosporangium siamense]GIG49672.1 UDP-N-acetylmuramoylalanine--D-glutamate ligase [Dactylosporangium siamense]
MQLADLRDRRVAVWGTGREGVAAVRAIAPAGPASLVAVDDRQNFLTKDWSPELAALAPLHTGPAGFDALRAADVVVRSPGVAQTHPWMVQLRAAGIRITGGTALWMAAHRDRTVGVTGSKGKSTTSSLVSHLLTAAGFANELGGNIGIPVLDLPPAPTYVLELSAYQCADLDDSPRVTAVTSLFPEHLDWTGGEDEYYRVKLNLVANDPAAVVVHAASTAVLAELSRRFTGLPLHVVGGEDSFHVHDGVFRLGAAPLFPRTALRLLGRHNEANLCIALGVLQAYGVDVRTSAGALEAALGTFAGLPHRLERIEDPSGLTFVDDSLSTIPQAAIHAIEAFHDRPLTVLLGGEDRGVDYTPLREHLAAAASPTTVIGMPDSGARLVALLEDLPLVTAYVSDSLVDAVALARKVTPAGGVVLMSPAAPSYGRFDNYAHRSKVFRQAITDSAL